MAALMLLYSVLLASLISIARCGNVQFSLNLTWETGAPDGYPRKQVFMNGQFPGPQLTLTQGDCVEFYVQNYLPYNATVHFHGIEQRGTPWSDGTPGLAQRPIPPGGSFKYEWNATQYGQYWYHGHYSGLVQDGLYGGILIHPLSNEPSPFASISSDSNDQKQMKQAEQNASVVMVSDWSKFTSEQYYNAEQQSNLDIYCVDSILVNGKGAVYCPPQSVINSFVNPNLAMLLAQVNESVSDKGCTPMSQGALTQGNFNNTDPNAVPEGLFSGCVASSGGMTTFYADPANGWISLNFVSALSAKAAQISIDKHKMWIYAVDGIYIKPMLVDTFLMYNGERYSAMVKLDQAPGAYTMHFANNIPDQVISGYASLTYTNAPSGSTANLNSSDAAINYGGASTSSSVVALDETSIQSFNVPPPSDNVSALYILTMGRYGSNWQWTLDGNASYGLQLQDMNPLLFTNHPQTAGEQNLTIRTNSGDWIDVILQSALAPSNPAQPPHPIHKHGNKGYLIGGATGTFNYSSVAEAQKAQPSAFNITTASYRDSFNTPAILQAPAWIAFRYQANDPGAWLMHCHIQTHLTGGMAVQILDGVDMWPKTPKKYLEGNGE